MAASTHGKARGELLCLGVARLLLPGTASHLRHCDFLTWTHDHDTDRLHHAALIEQLAPIRQRCMRPATQSRLPTIQKVSK